MKLNIASIKYQIISQKIFYPGLEGGNFGASAGMGSGL